MGGCHEEYELRLEEPHSEVAARTRTVRMEATQEKSTYCLAVQLETEELTTVDLPTSDQSMPQSGFVSD